MDFRLSEEQSLIIQNVRRFIREEIRPLEADLDPDAFQLPPAESERLVGMTKAMGLYQRDIPTEYGGMGVDVMTRTLVAEEMAAFVGFEVFDLYGDDPERYVRNASRVPRHHTRESAATA